MKMTFLLTEPRYDALNPSDACVPVINLMFGG